MALTLRSVKGSRLTSAEADANIQGLRDLSLTQFTPANTGAQPITVREWMLAPKVGIAGDSITTKWYRGEMISEGLSNYITLLGYNIAGIGDQIENTSKGAIMMGMEPSYKVGGITLAEWHVNLWVPGAVGFLRPFSAYRNWDGPNQYKVVAEILGDQHVSVFTPLLSMTAKEIRTTNANTGSTMLSLRNSDTGGKFWELHSTGSAASGGAGNLSIYNGTNGRFAALFPGGTSGGISLGTQSVTATDLDGSSLIQLGNVTDESAGERTAIRFRLGGFGAPSDVSTLANGDKLAIWNTSTFKAGIGLEGGGMWFQANGSATTAGFKWYGGTGSSPSELLALRPAGWLVHKEVTSNPGTSDLTADAGVAIYNKADKLVFAYNNGGTMTYITLDLDGSDITWAHGTGAP